MSDTYMIMALIAMGLLLVGFVWSQNSVKDKLLVTFHRQNLTKVEKWVPVKSRHVYFGKAEGGHPKFKGMYEVNPKHIELMWYTRGILFKLFPRHVPAIEFRWNSPMSINPRTSLNTWHTPETRAAAWEEHQQIAFARGTAQQVGKKERFPNWFIPAICLGVVMIVLYLVWMQGAKIGAIESYLGSIR